MLYSVASGQWKLMDFGISAPLKTNGLTTEFSRGTSGYRAPELLNDNPRFTKQVDLWALGCIMYEMSYGKLPFSLDFAFIMYAQSSDQIIMLDKVCTKFCDYHQACLLRQLLCRDWKERPEISDVCWLLRSYLSVTTHYGYMSVVYRGPFPSFHQWIRMFCRCVCQQHVALQLAKFYRTRLGIDGSRYLVRQFMANLLPPMKDVPKWVWFFLPHSRCYLYTRFLRILKFLTRSNFASSGATYQGRYVLATRIQTPQQTWRTGAGSPFASITHISPNRQKENVQSVSVAHMMASSSYLSRILLLM